LDDGCARQTAPAHGALERGAEQLALERMRPDVIVADGGGIDGAPDDEGDAAQVLRTAVFPEKRGEGTAGDSFDDAPQPSLDLGRLGRPGAPHGVGWLGGGGEGGGR